MNNPADTMAALAPCPFCGSAARLCEPTCDKFTPYNASHRAFPVVRCKCGAEVAGRDWDQRGTSAIAAWNRRASLKGDAEPRKPDGYAYRYPHHDGDTVIRFTCGQEINGARPIEAVPYFYGTPTAPQGGGEAAHWKSITDRLKEEVDGYEFRGDEGDYTPNERERMLLLDFAMGLPDELFATPPAQQPGANDSELPGMWSSTDFTGGDPDERSYADRAQQPGEVGEAAIFAAARKYSTTEQDARMRQTFEFDDHGLREFVAALAPKEKGNG